MVPRRIVSFCVLLVVFSTQISSQGPPPAGSYTLPNELAHWMSIAADIDGDGNEEIVMTTMDPGMVNTFTPPTPVLILGASGTRITDQTKAFFGDNGPRAYSSKPVAGDFDGDGRLDLLICDRGRNDGPQPPWGTSGTEGKWRAQNIVLLQRDGVLVNANDRYPQTIACNWGCSAGDIDGSGRDAIVINTFGPVPGYGQAYVVQWDGHRFIKTLDLSDGGGNVQGGGNREWGWSIVEDFNKDGKADIVGGKWRKVVWGGGTGLANMRDFPQSQLDKAGYTFHRGAETADFNGDGYPDYVQSISLAEPTLSESRSVLYLSDGRGALVEKVDAFPAVSAYNASDFGNERAVLDVDFDGDLDITTFGTVYSFNAPQRPPTAVWLNDGSGRFSLADWSDAIQTSQTCNFSESYFLKAATPDTYQLVFGGCGKRYVTRTVTKQQPLRFTPR